MLKKLFLLCLAFPSLLKANPIDSDFDAYVEALMSQNNIPGVAVGIIKNGNIIHLKGYGYRDKERRLKVNPDTQFSIGSLSKAFASHVSLLLADRGLLNPYATILSQMPSFQLSSSTATRSATIIDLLSHQSGQARHDLMWLGSKATQSTLVKRLPHLETHLSFRGQYYYNNLMYMETGHIAEKLSGKPWKDWVTNDILKPLNMSRSNTSTRDFRSNYAHPYWYQGSKLVKREIRITDNMGPAASVNSTARDMLKWAHYALKGVSLEGTRLLSSKNYRLWQSPQVRTNIVSPDPNFEETDYALGWRISAYKGTKIVRHGGSIGSYLSHLLLLPEHNTGIVVLQNADHKSLVGALAYRAADSIMGETPTAAHNDRASLSYDWQDEDFEQEKHVNLESQTSVPSARKFSGTYSNPGYGQIEVSQNGDIKLSYNDWTVPLWDQGNGSATSNGRFFSSASYTTNSQGRVESLSLPLEPRVASIDFIRLD